MNELYPLLTGFLAWPEPPSPAPVWHPVYAYLIVTPEQQSILVDTGTPRVLVNAPNALPWFSGEVRMTPEDGLASRLSSVGRSKSDIDLLIATHFDFDHCGNSDLFDGSKIQCVVQAKLLEHARTSDRNDRTLWDRPGITLTEIHGDLTIVPGFTLLESSGHAPGHQSVLVETSHGNVMLTIDAIADRHALGEGPYPSFYVDDARQWRRSRSKLLSIAAEHDAVLLFGHDPVQSRFLTADTGPLRITQELRQSGAPVLRAK